MPAHKWTSARRAAFLAALAETGNVSRAARAAKASRSRAYQLKAEDADFADEWNDALEIATDALDAEARRRAIDGVETPRFHQGRVAGTVRKYSDFRARTRADGGGQLSPPRFGSGAQPRRSRHGGGLGAERDHLGLVGIATTWRTSSFHTATLSTRRPCREGLGALACRPPIWPTGNHRRWHEPSGPLLATRL